MKCDCCREPIKGVDDPVARLISPPLSVLDSGCTTRLCAHCYDATREFIRAYGPERRGELMSEQIRRTLETGDTVVGGNTVSCGGAKVTFTNHIRPE